MKYGQLFFNKDERLCIGGTELTCGSPVEVLVLDKEHKPIWYLSRVEHNGEAYYIVDLQEIQPEGLFARI